MAGSEILGELSLRTKLVNVIPAATFLAIVGSLVLSGAPADEPRLKTLEDNVNHLGWPGAGAAAAAVVIGALLLEPLELASIRFLEGYWNPSGPLAGLGQLVIWLYERRRSRAEFLKDFPVAAGVSARAANKAALLPQPGTALPTSLGNRLRKFEQDTGRVYRLNAIQVWPRLHHVLPERVLNSVNQYRTQMDVAARLCVSLVAGSLVATGLLVVHGWWLALPATLLGSAWLAYRSAFAAAGVYATAVTSAIDVYRLHLLETMRIERPADTVAEREINLQLSLLWTGFDQANVSYEKGQSEGGGVPESS
jgi:hypothetical protein